MFFLLVLVGPSFPRSSLSEISRSCSLCKPKCEDRRRPPYLFPKGTTRPLFADRATGSIYSLLSCSSNRVKRDSYSIYYVSLSAKIGDGRHISSEARTRPLFADRAAA